MVGYLARDARLHQDGGTPLDSHVSYTTSYRAWAPAEVALGVFGQLDEILDDPAVGTCAASHLPCENGTMRSSLPCHNATGRVMRARSKPHGLTNARSSSRQPAIPVLTALRNEVAAHSANGPVSEARSDRKSTRLNSSHVEISYAVFCLKKKKKNKDVSQIATTKNNKVG